MDSARERETNERQAYGMRTQQQKFKLIPKLFCAGVTLWMTHRLGKNIIKLTMLFILTRIMRVNYAKTKSAFWKTAHCTMQLNTEYTTVLNEI